MAQQRPWDEIGFEQFLAEQWSVDRNDIYSEGIASPQVIRNSQPMRPSSVIKALGISEAGLVALLNSGRLPKPGDLGHGRVAWRFDEIDRLTGYRL